MRKTISLLFSFILIFFFSFTIAKAECSYAKQSELNALASNVKYSVEPKEEKIVYPATETSEEHVLTTTFFELQLLNITEEMKISVYNNFLKTTTTYTYNDVKDGALSISSGTGTSIVTFKVDIYGTGECSTQLLRTFEVKTPMVNPYRAYADCKNAPEYYLCQEYLTEDVNFNFQEANSAVKEYIKNKEKEKQEEKEKQKTFMEKLNSFLKKYWWVGIIIVILGMAITFVIYKNRKERIL